MPERVPAARGQNGLAARAGAVESLVDELSDEERLELRRLLEEALSSGGGA